MTYHEAKDFFAELYGGETCIPSEIKGDGLTGWKVWQLSELSSISLLTKLVFMAHAKGIRVSVIGHGMSRIKIMIERQPSHPGIERFRSWQVLS